ncbi:MAG TPA: hypothetical protein VK636_09825 [Gemmatimonadaceae bacterium]|nr:hypothetical protein [Gemmatimonadaceae bacterium]
MNVIEMAVSADVEVGHSRMTHELARLHSNIADHLRRAGAQLPAEVMTDLGEKILIDAVRVALVWLGEDSSASLG